MERASRKICVEMGSIASTCKAPRTGAEVKEWGIHFTVTKAIGIGRRVREAQRRHEDPVAAILDEAGGKQSVPRQSRRRRPPRDRGVSARPLRSSKGSTRTAAARLELAFQNEWVVAWRDGAPLAMSPDLICVLDTVSGDAFGTETIRYGMRVTVIALPAPAGVPDAEGARACRPARLRLRPRFPLGVRVSRRTVRRIGIDVGGTNTDAVLLEDGRVVHAVKTPTTEDVTGGIVDALWSCSAVTPTSRRVRSTAS